MRTLDEIIADFEFLDDWEDRYRYLIELGRDLPPYPDDKRDPDHLVRGCASQVWVDTEIDGGVMRVRADSDAHIVRGLVALAIATYADRPPAEVATTEMEPIVRRIGLDGHLTPQRANGFASLVSRIRAAASAAA